MNRTDTHDADAPDIDEVSGSEAPIGAPPSGPPSLPPPERSSGPAPPPSLPATAIASTPNRFGSAAPLAPPRPGRSSAPPRPSPRSPTPPAVRLAGPPLAPLALPPPLGLPAPNARPSDTALDELRAELESTVRALAGQRVELRTVLGQRDARIAEVATLQRELEACQRAHAEHVQKLEQALAEAQIQHAPHDDLQLIRGIGPAFARELARIGVRTYAQIAAWTDADLQAIAPRIKARVERIRRDDWPKSAAQLLAERKRG